MRMDDESLQCDRKMYFILTQDVQTLGALMEQVNKTIYKTRILLTTIYIPHL